jgi:hypothetical protein
MMKEKSHIDGIPGRSRVLADGKKKCANGDAAEKKSRMKRENNAAHLLLHFRVNACREGTQRTQVSAEFWDKALQ